MGWYGARLESKATDSAGFREAQRKNWDAAAAGWKDWSEFNDRADAHISERLVELAGVQSGTRVLDVAAGYGEPALTAARKAGPEGHVVATDISAETLAFGRERAAAAGLGNVEFIESDAFSLDFPHTSFDAGLALGNHLRARRGSRRSAHPRVPHARRADCDRLVGRARSGPLPLDSSHRPRPERPGPSPGTPAAIGGCSEEVGSRTSWWSRTSPSSSTPRSTSQLMSGRSPRRSGDDRATRRRLPGRGLGRDHKGRSGCGRRLEAAELVERGAAHLGPSARRADQRLERGFPTVSGCRSP
jgi:SAM-dependent methyltransferase